MLRSKIISVTTVFLFVFGIVMINCAVAGETMRWHGTSFSTDWKQIEVGDEEGHVLAVSSAKQLYVDEKTGEKSVGDDVNTMDINMKTGQGSLSGYGWTADKDGDKIIRTHEGKPVGKGHWKGTFKYIKGTGKYEGIKGSGTWDSYSMGQGEPSYIEVEGDIEMPGQ
jgi:hypothetical protein